MTRASIANQTPAAPDTGSRFFWCTVLALCLLPGCSGPGPAQPTPADAVAVFSGGVVLRSELDAHTLASDPEGDRSRPTPAPGADWREEGIRAIAIRKTLIAESPTDPELAALIESDVSVLLVEEMAQALGWNDLSATEEEIRAQYDANPEQYNDPERLRLQHIFIRAEAAELSPAERAAARGKIEEVRVQLVDGADFTAMARLHSESATAPSGGWMVLKRGAPVDPSFVETAWDLDLDEISEVVDTANGFHVLVARERFPALSRDFATVREFARKRTLTAKRSQLEREFVAEVGPSYDLQVHHEALEIPGAGDDTVLVRWSSGTFTKADLLVQLPAAYVEHYFNRYLPKVHEFVDQVALNRLLYEEAKRTGLAEREEVVAEMERLAGNRKAEAALNRRLHELVSLVPDDEMRAYFEQNEKRYQTLRTHDLSLILLPPGDNLWQTLKFGEELVERIRAGEPFAELARSLSIHPSAVNGGRMVGVDHHELAKTVQSTAKFRRVLGELADGETAPAMVAECYDPDRLRFVPTGVLVFRLDGTTPASQVSYEEVELIVRGNYLRRNYSRLVEDVESEILDEIGLEILVDRLPPV